MQVQVNAGDVQNSQAIIDRVTSEVEESLSVHADRVTRVEVHLHDDNSAAKAGSADKRCTMEARIAGMQPLVVEQNAEDLYQAIHQASGKLERAVRHAIERRSER